MSDNAIGAENQQGSLRQLADDPSETTRRTPTTKFEIIAYLNGAIHDASLNKGRRIRFTQQNKQWLKNLQGMLKQISCNSWIYKEGKNRNIFTLETLCKHLDFKFDPTKLKSNEEKSVYVRGFFDAEGGIPYTKDRFYIQLAQKDLKKMKQIKSLLNDLEIQSGVIHNPSKKVDPDYWRIFISANSYKRFAEVVNSCHPVKAKILCERTKI